MMLIERERELERIEALMAAATTGHGSTLFIEGVPGIGKSALLRAARDRARERGLVTLSGMAAELERGLPFGVVRQLFEPMLRGVDDVARRELLAGAAHLAQGPLGLVADRDAAELPSAVGSALHGLYWLCANLADRNPVLLVVDDLHWADEPSLRFLIYLGRRVQEHPLLILAASRPAPSKSQGAVAASLGAVPSDVLQLRALSDTGVEHLVRETLAGGADPEFCVACARASGGNPFLLSETLTALRADGIEPVAAEAKRVDSLRPETVSHVVLARLARLGLAATRVAHAVAVLGSDAVLRRVARLGDLETQVAGVAVQSLQRDGILGPGRELEFLHPLVRNAVYGDLGEPARGLAHLRAARLVHDEGEDVSRVARHLLVSEPNSDPWVVHTLRSAAAAALARGAPETAIALLRRARSEPPQRAARGPVLFELGCALARAGRADAAADALRRAMELTPDPRSRADVALELGPLLNFAGHPTAALDVMQETRDLLADDESERALGLEVEIAVASHFAQRPARTWVGRLEAAAAAAAAASPAQRTILATLAYIAAGTGTRPAAEVLRLASMASQHSPSPGESVHLMIWAAGALSMGGDANQGIELLDRGIGAARGVGDAAWFRTLSMLRARLAFEVGRVREAEADARAALDAYEEGAASFGYAIGALVLALVECGRLDEAQAALAEHGLAETRNLDVYTHHIVMQSRGRLRLAEGRPSDALDDLTSCGEMLVSGGFTNPAVCDWRSDAALAHLALGEREPAHRLATEELRLGRAFGQNRVIGTALRTLGLVEGGDHGLELLRESVAVLEDSYADLLQAHALVDYGAALRRARRRRDAREPLRRGLDLASRCSAPPLAKRAREELVAAGARPRRTLLSGPESLTASELRVARLAVEGKTNPEIAQALFVTRRTVEVHLTSMYRKLDIDSRQALPAALGAEPL
jgi:DNA-binding CsgD family transcriptional regulator